MPSRRGCDNPALRGASKYEGLVAGIRRAMRTRSHLGDDACVPSSRSSELVKRNASSMWAIRSQMVAGVDDVILTIWTIEWEQKHYSYRQEQSN